MLQAQVLPCKSSSLMGEVETVQSEKMAGRMSLCTIKEENEWHCSHSRRPVTLVQFGLRMETRS